jgi:phospholipid/cholesterol/gamma-HCH transport system substrate-binding protein
VERDGRLALVVGSFVIGALVALSGAILSLTSERGIFVSHYRMEARFQNVQGLLPGAPVWLAGKEVGRVEDIRFEPVGSAVPVLVLMGIDETVQDRIRGDSVATVGTIGVLGDSYVEISVGTVGEAMLEPGSEIRTQSPININLAMAKGSRALDNVANLAENLNDVISRFTEGDGERTVVDGFAAAGDIMVRVQQGPGLLHSLIYDDYQGEGVQSIERSLVLLEKVLHEIVEGDGLLHQVIYTKPEDRGLMSQAATASVRLNSILEKIDEGEGTIGLMLNDPSLYEELQALLGGARRSLVVRSMVRMAADKAEDASE